MSETLPPPEGRPQMTPAQELTLRGLCERYGVEFSRDHYFVARRDDTVFMPGYAEGWLGGREHANPQYVTYEPTGKPTLYVGVSPEGEAHS